MAEHIFEVQPVLNPSLLRVQAIWSPGGEHPTWATLHWTVVPREHWPEGWLPPEDFRWQRRDYFPDAVNPFSQEKKDAR